MPIFLAVLGIRAEVRSVADSDAAAPIGIWS
jgi:hypothetical protein